MSYPRPALCPCCKFPTLNENGGYEICVICWWEDDGQTDKDADNVRGGPNSHYSLTHAQKNFADHGDMYDKGRGIQVVQQPSSARLKLLDYLKTIGFAPAQADPTKLGELLSAEDRHVRQVRRQACTHDGGRAAARQAEHAHRDRVRDVPRGCDRALRRLGQAGPAGREQSSETLWYP